MTVTPIDIAQRRRERLASRPPIESIDVDEASTGLAPSGIRKYRAKLIKPGWGASGYYPADVLRRDGPQVWPAGTLSFADHPTPTEEAERPVRSIRDVVARIASTPQYEADNPDGPGLYADVEVFPHAAPLIEALADTIGMSIRANATANWGTKDGREGWIVESLDHGKSVDFVTRPGAGGKLVSLLESARSVEEARNIGAWLESRLHLDLTQLADDMYGQGRITRDERITLSNAIGDALTSWTNTVEKTAPQLFQRDLYDDPDDTDGSDGMDADVQEATASVDVTEADAEPYGDVAYADPGYQSDKQKRYPIDTADHTRTAWSYINRADDASNYSAADLKKVKDRIKSAAKKFGIEISDQSESADVPAATGMPVNEAQATDGVPPVVSETHTDGKPPAVPTHQNGGTPVGAEETGATASGAGQAGEGQTTSVNEAALAAQLRVTEQQRDEAVARATALTEARNQAATATAERDRAVAEARTLRANQTGESTVRRMVAEAANIPAHFRGLVGPRVAQQIVGRVPLTESTGEVDITALEGAVASAIEGESTYAAAILEAGGAGRVAGLGGSLKPGEMSEADFEKQLGGVLADLGLSEAELKTAVKGR